MLRSVEALEDRTDLAGGIERPLLSDPVPPPPSGRASDTGAEVVGFHRWHSSEVASVFLPRIPSDGGDIQ